MQRFTYTNADSVPLSLLVSSILAAFNEHPEFEMQGNSNARHVPEFLAKTFGYRNRNSMHAEASAVDAKFPRFESLSAVSDWIATRVQGKFEEVFRVRISEDIADALVIAMLPALSLFHVSQLSEGRPIDNILVRAGAQPFEYATLRVPNSGAGAMSLDDASYAFSFQRARDNYAQLPEDWSSGKSEAEQMAFLNEHVVRPAWQRAIDVVTAGMRPDNHQPVVVVDTDGFVVGITFVHTIHGGIVPGLCLSPKDITTMLRNVIMGYTAAQGMESDRFYWSTHSSTFFTSSIAKRNEPAGSPSFVKVSYDHAYRIAGQLKNARNGVRVPAPPGKRTSLLNASIRSQEVIHGANGSGYKSMEFAMSTTVGGPAPTGTMTLNGSLSAPSADEYVRQHAWKDEADFPQLFPAGRTIPLPEDTTWMFTRDDDGYTKVLPDYIRNFQARAEALLEHKRSRGSSTHLDSVASALAEQRALMNEIVELERATAEARKVAGFYKLFSVHGPILE